MPLEDRDRPALRAERVSDAAPKLSMTDTAYQRIRDDIVRCVLPPGLEFTEIDIANRLAMSKTPVREALMRLQFEGFVKAFPRRGYVVETVKMSDINDIFDMRVVIEAGAIELAVTRISDAELAALVQLAGAISDDTYGESPNRSHSVNIAFHQTIARASRNVRLFRAVTQSLGELERFFYLEARASAPYPERHASHGQIVELLQSRDGPQARAAIIDHIEGTRAVLMNAVIKGFAGGTVLMG